MKKSLWERAAHLNFKPTIKKIPTIKKVSFQTPSPSHILLGPHYNNSNDHNKGQDNL